MDHSGPVRLRLTTAVTAFTTTLEVDHWRTEEDMTAFITIKNSDHFLTFLRLHLSTDWTAQPAPPDDFQPRPWWRPADRAERLRGFLLSRDQEGSAALQPADLKIINPLLCSVLTEISKPIQYNSGRISIQWVIHHRSSGSHLFPASLSDESQCSIFSIHCAVFVLIFYSMQFQGHFPYWAVSLQSSIISIWLVSL